MRYAFWAWMDRYTKWAPQRVRRWIVDRAWDAVFAKHAEAMDAEADRLLALIREDKANG